MNVNDIIADVQRLEVAASKIGLHITARALNNAKNAAGWEAAGNVEKAASAIKR